MKTEKNRREKRGGEKRDPMHVRIEPATSYSAAHVTSIEAVKNAPSYYTIIIANLNFCDLTLLARLALPIIVFMSQKS